MRRVLPITLLLLTACGGESPTPITTCTSGNGITPDCRFQNPEDLVVLPSGQGLLVSQFGTMDGSAAGNIALYRPGLANDEPGARFPTGQILDDRQWGDPQCPPPDVSAFAPHGIDLVQRDDGRWALLVVNHGLRESVEFLEVDDSGVDVQLSWRGCAEGPPQAYFNDVAGSRSGGFWVTQMMPKDSQTRSMLASALFGMDTGFVYAWNPEGGFQPVPGSDGPFPNGVQKNADESALYINMYLGSQVRKLDLQTFEVTAMAPISSPDNLSWSSDGRLLVASHTDGFFELTACQSLESGSCGFAFEIHSLDPEDLTGTVIASNRGAPMGAATVAVDLDGRLYMGTFAGDRVASQPYAAAAR